MSKSAKTTVAKPFNQKKESDKNMRKLAKTLGVKMDRERVLDPYYDMRRAQQQAFLDRAMTRKSVYGN